MSKARLKNAAGNRFFSKYAISASYIAAYDDNSTDAFIAENGFAAIGDIAGLRLVANFGGSSFDSGDEISLNFGFDYNVFDMATVGAAFKNVTNDEFSASVYAGLTFIDGLILNLGFLCNAKDTDFIADAAKLALSVSGCIRFRTLERLLPACASALKKGRSTRLPFRLRGNTRWSLNESSQQLTA